MRKLKKIFLLIMDLLLQQIPMNRKMAMFDSFHGLYADNSKYVSEMLHEQYPDFEIYWVLDNRANRKDIPEYVHQLKEGTFKYIYYKNRALFLMDNFAGWNGYRTKNWIKAKLPVKKKGQINYSTWHGTPIKKIGSDIFEDKCGVEKTSSTLYIINSRYFANIAKRCFPKGVPIVLEGSPRNDILFQPGKEFYYKKKLGLPTNKRIVLYAPTYRSPDASKFSGVSSVYFSNDEIGKVLVALEQRFYGEFVFVSRAHQLVRDIKNESQFIDKKIFNGNLHDDMAEYLYVADVLITDYSGSLFDFTLTQKPCFLYAPDIEQYCNDRGMYMNMDQLPYAYAQNIEELIKIISKFDSDAQKKKIIDFNNMLGVVEDGNATLHIIEMLKKDIS